ncbi:MAG: hypothetical protein AB1670_20640 [Pseudomonadota bacterium]
MARIRTIKPEFWCDERVVELSAFARLLFIGLWNFVDDCGRIEFSPVRLKLQIFPADNVDVLALFAELEGTGLVTVYTVDGRRFLQVDGFRKHQKIDKRLPSRFPAPPGCTDSPEFSPNHSNPPQRPPSITDSPVVTPNHGCGRDQGRDQGTDQGMEVKANIASETDDARATSKPPDCPHQQIIALYHEVLPMCPKVRDWTTARATQLRARWNEDPTRQNLDYWRRYFEYVKTCPFLVGVQPDPKRRPFFADLEWLTKAANFTKVREAKYEN